MQHPWPPHRSWSLPVHISAQVDLIEVLVYEPPGRAKDQGVLSLSLGAGPHTRISPNYCMLHPKQETVVSVFTSDAARAR